MKIKFQPTVEKSVCEINGWEHVDHGQVGPCPVPGGIHSTEYRVTTLSGDERDFIRESSNPRFAIGDLVRVMAPPELHIGNKKIRLGASWNEPVERLTLDYRVGEWQLRIMPPIPESKEARQQVPQIERERIPKLIDGLVALIESNPPHGAVLPHQENRARFISGTFKIKDSKVLGEGRVDSRSQTCRTGCNGYSVWNEFTTTYAITPVRGDLLSKLEKNVMLRCHGPLTLWPSLRQYEIIVTGTQLTLIEKHNYSSGTTFGEWDFVKVWDVGQGLGIERAEKLQLNYWLDHTKVHVTAPLLLEGTDVALVEREMMPDVLRGLKESLGKKYSQENK